MFGWIRRHLFEMRNPAEEAEAILREAQLALVKHEAAAEFHDAMATMYRKRIERIEGNLLHHGK